MEATRAARLWARRTWRSDLLMPLALLFGALSAARRLTYRLRLAQPRSLRAPTIVVGNIAVGGTGKTPLVIAIVLRLIDAGFHPGVISRGYGGDYAKRGVPWTEVLYDDASIFGDETVLIRQRTRVPCAVGVERYVAGEQLLAAHPEIDVIVCDDGLQHYGLRRDFEVVVIDSRGLGNGRLLPAGPLREFPRRASRANAVVLNGSETQLPKGVRARAVFHMRLVPGKAWRLIDRTQTRALETFRSGTIAAIAGIGHPERFFATLADAGIECERVALADHFVFDEDFFRGESADTLLITEKDAVKCSNLADPRIWVVPVTAEFDPGLETLLLEKIRAYR
jgi:tetraacyldisaccharide 4'-kinase